MNDSIALGMRGVPDMLPSRGGGLLVSPSAQGGQMPGMHPCV